jgi:alkylation response protein AidB-like acyl-CoA dehydrogenase
VHSRLADMHVEIEAARLLALDAACLMARDQPAGEVLMVAKIQATEAAVRVADHAMRTFAGWGLCTDFAIERLYRDSLANVPAGLTTDRIREFLVCSQLGVDPWRYDPFDWLSNAGLAIA